MYSFLSTVAPALSLFAIPLFAGPARASPINNGHVFANDKLPASRYDRREIATIDYEKRGLPAALLNSRAVAQPRMRREAPSFEKREATVIVDLPKMARRALDDGSESNVKLQPTKRWGGYGGGCGGCRGGCGGW
ncbi:hypothetical protein BT63DRAFT_415958 [Microthyrium microscopicum]|uniref:Uncharacterized protein n=1 Tax=Microthyrium microscopicum TaxID=703497 RepID=A0A6A6U713_9PEZI|nr:hypothetical protein BT63DRAFT_415958 [Microthyrium microscopicum]